MKKTGIAITGLLFLFLASAAVVDSAGVEKATFAGGCFWCMEHPFDEIPGEVSVTSGYTGGHKKNPTYKEVSAGGTGHAEAVQVAYDPARVSYEKLLEIFWHNIDPTTKVQRGRSLWKWFRTSRESELIVVVGEDIAALLGLLLALIAVLATIVTSNPLFDALGTIAIGSVLILIAVAVGVEVKSLLIGESADEETVSALRDFLSGRQEVSKIYHLITLQLGGGILVSVKAKMQEGDEAARLIGDINRVETDLKRQFPKVKWVFFEPDVRD